MCAAGALLSILHREGLLRSPPHASLSALNQDTAGQSSSALRTRGNADTHFWVESLSELHLLGHLCVDSASMQALQLFQVRDFTQVPLPYEKLPIHRALLIASLSVLITAATAMQAALSGGARMLFESLLELHLLGHLCLYASLAGIQVLLYKTAHATSQAFAAS